MSETVTIKKTVDIEVDSETVSLDKEIDFDIDSLSCENCGNEMSFTVNVDSFGDLQLTVSLHECPE